MSRLKMKRRLEQDPFYTKRQRVFSLKRSAEPLDHGAKRMRYDTNTKRKHAFQLPPAKRVRHEAEDVLRRQLVDAYARIHDLEQRVKELSYLASIQQQQIINPYLPTIQCH